MKKKEKRRKKLLWILIPSAVVLLAAAAVLVLYFVKVDSFSVKGNLRLSEGQITELLYPEEEDRRLYKVLYGQLAGLRENQAFESASVRLSGLTSAVITVEESEPAFVVATDMSVYYYNRYGIRLPEPEHVEVAYPKLAGVRFTRSDLLKKPAMSPEESAVYEECCLIFRTAALLQLPTDSLFVSDGEFTISFRKVRVSLGTSDYMLEKLHEISYQFDHYEGLSGTLHMEAFDPDDPGQSYWFSVDTD